MLTRGHGWVNVLVKLDDGVRKTLCQWHVRFSCTEQKHIH